MVYGNSGEEDSYTVSRYAIISPIRALRIRKSDPAKWNLLWSHMSHQESRRKSKYWCGDVAKIEFHIWSNPNPINPIANFYQAGEDEEGYQGHQGSSRPHGR